MAAEVHGRVDKGEEEASEARQEKIMEKDIRNAPVARQKLQLDKLARYFGIPWRVGSITLGRSGAISVE